MQELTPHLLGETEPKTHLPTTGPVALDAFGGRM
jgi:hypothetical protein